jgi:hypothetical protein
VVLSSSLSAERVDLVDENDGGAVEPCHLKQDANELLAVAAILARQSRRRNVEKLQTNKRSDKINPFHHNNAFKSISHLFHIYFTSICFHISVFSHLSHVHPHFTLSCLSSFVFCFVLCFVFCLCAALCGDGLCEKRLARSRRPVQEHSRPRTTNAPKIVRNQHGKNNRLCKTQNKLQRGIETEIEIEIE